MKCHAARLPPAWRWVAMGLLLSAAGALGIVSLASAHSAGAAAGPQGTAAPPVPPEPPAHPVPVLPHAPGGLGLALLGGLASERLLDEIQASPAQRAQIARIVQDARTDLQAGAEGGRATAARLAELIGQPVLDEAAFEAQRRQVLQRHDEASRRAQAALLAAAKVLTPAQRQQLASHWAQRAERPMHERPAGGHRAGPGGEPPRAR